AALRFANNVFNVLDRYERPHPVVDRHDPCPRLKMLQPRRHGVLTPLAAFNHAHRLPEARRSYKIPHFSGGIPRGGYDHVVDNPAGIKLADGVNDDGRAIQDEQLLRPIALHSPPETRGSDNGANLHKDNSSRGRGFREKSKSD